MKEDLEEDVEAEKEEEINEKNINDRIKEKLLFVYGIIQKAFGKIKNLYFFSLKFHSLPM